MVDPEKEITSKANFHNSPINSNTNKYYNVSPTPQSLKNSTPSGGESLENSIPNEVSTFHKETQHDESHMNLSSINLDMEYWSNFLLEDMETLNDVSL